MTHVRINDLTKRYDGAELPAVANLSLDIPSGELIALLGPSGCGKTTILKMIAGLIRPTGGDVAFDGGSVLNTPPERRGAVMVFQNHLLFTYMSVGQNVGFGLKMAGIAANIIDHKVKEMLALVRLPDISDRKPRQLSGGQQQRVALARALITQPRVLLLDEPLSNLDAHLRDEMRELILSVQRALGITTIFVTHDQEEAVLLADRIAMIFEGRLHQFASPDVFYRHPASERIARFLGGVNFLPGKRAGDTVHTDVGSFRFAAGSDGKSAPGQGLLTIRPEQIVLDGPPAENTVQGRVISRIFVGTYTRYRLALGDHQFEAVRSADIAGDFEEGQEIPVTLPADRVWMVSSDTPAKTQAGTAA
jgi:ABC-type Fe3+/spermidine/putrescine transport system ATPase subunit